MVQIWHCAPLLLLAACLGQTKNTNLQEVFHWKQVDFQYPDEATRSKAIESKAFIQANNLPLGLEVWKHKLFVTVPRWKAGVPSTLNYVSLKGKHCVV